MISAVAAATAGIVLLTTPIYQAQSSVLTVSEVILNLGDIEGLVGLAWRSFIPVAVRYGKILGVFLGIIVLMKVGLIPILVISK